MIQTDESLSDLLRDAEQTAGLLDAVAGSSGQSDHRIIEVATHRRSGIARARTFLLRGDHKVAFVGQIGVGKSSIIGLTCGLVLGEVPPADRAELARTSVLAIGSGGTTVCEVRIKNSPPEYRSQIGLRIEPFSDDEMRREINFFAEDEWRRRRAPSTEPANEVEELEPTPREVRRVIRSMTGLTEQFERSPDNGKKVRVDPLDGLISDLRSVQDLTDDLVMRAKLSSRTRTEWWWESDDATLPQLKEQFAAINHGTDSMARLPRRVTLYLPQILPSIDSRFDIEVIDTRGFDGQLAGRRDIQELLYDDRALIVICVPFREAPGELVKNLLRDIKANGALRQAIPRLQLLLMDQGDAEGVNGANGDREVGQQIKEYECQRALNEAGLGDPFGTSLVSHDSLRDPVARIHAMLAGRLRQMRESVAMELRTSLTDARDFISNIEDKRRLLAEAEVDSTLARCFRANAPQSLPMRDALEGLYEAIEGARFASQVFASMRRSGVYAALDAYAAIESGAATMATRWIESTQNAVRAECNTLLSDDGLNHVQGHIRLRAKQLDDAIVRHISDFATDVHEMAEPPLAGADELWQRCAAEWGRGRGFKNRVIEHLRVWSQQTLASPPIEVEAAPRLAKISGLLGT